MSISNWMSWEGGVDLVAVTNPSLAMPNVIVHVARVVHTPVGSAPAGMIFWQPDANAAPVVMGFISSNPTVGAYFGPKIFAGTPFESAPVLEAEITVRGEGDQATARVVVAGHTFETSLNGLGDAELISREPAPTAPFFQQGLERVAATASLTVDGQAVNVIVPPVGISGGPAAVFSPNGLYAR